MLHKVLVALLLLLAVLYPHRAPQKGVEGPKSPRHPHCLDPQCVLVGKVSATVGKARLPLPWREQLLEDARHAVTTTTRPSKKATNA